MWGAITNAGCTSLDIDRCETPLQAFSAREATDAIRKSDPKWMERKHQ